MGLTPTLKHKHTVINVCANLLCFVFPLTTFAPNTCWDQRLSLRPGAFWLAPRMRPTVAWVSTCAK